MLAATLTLTLAACGGTGGEEEPAGKKAAEPGRAPAVTAKAAGESYSVGDLPQGAVFDDQTGLLAVATRDPFRLQLLDPDTVDVVRSVPLPGKVRHLQLAGPGGPVLVPIESANEIWEVSLPDGEVRSTEVERQPHDAASAANGDVVVGNEFSGSISVVRDGQVVKTFDDLLQPGGVVTDGDTAVVIDVKDYSVTTYDLDAMERVDRIAAGEGPTHGVVIGGGRLAVTDTRGGTVLIYDIDPLKQVGEIKLGDRPYGITVDRENDLVWVTLITKNELVGLDVSEDTPKVIARYPTERQADTVAVDRGSKRLWVTGTAEGLVQRIER
jgi:DNA-binding beta-propeller fold protein YncE